MSQACEAVRIHACPPVAGAIRPPGSKSITNRAIVCAALARGRSRLTGVLDSEDTQVMISAWQQLGLELNHRSEVGQLEVGGCGGRLSNSPAELFVANSGTTIRFLTAALAGCQTEAAASLGASLAPLIRLDGVERMRQRPIGDLLVALRQLGAEVRSLNGQREDCPPVEIRPQRLAGGEARIAGNMSSQFLSGLMMAAPLAENTVHIVVEGQLVSVPYVEMTRQVMQAFGVDVKGPASGPLTIESGQRYIARDYEIEPDASAASYFWAAAAITAGRARVEGLNRQSLQGDVDFCQVLQRMGCGVEYGPDFIEVQGGPLRGIDVDMADISDTVQSLAAVALFAKGPTRVHGVAHNRLKETDRISDLATELRKLGADVEEFEDGLAIWPPASILPARICTYQDHRMAMSLALVGLAVDGITIVDPDCTAKTYPGYWRDLAQFSACRIERLD